MLMSGSSCIPDLPAAPSLPDLVLIEGGRSQIVVASNGLIVKSKIVGQSFHHMCMSPQITGDEEVQYVFIELPETTANAIKPGATVYLNVRPGHSGHFKNLTLTNHM